MIVLKEPSFRNTWNVLRMLMRGAPEVSTERWQGISVKGNPAAVTRELQMVEIEVPLKGIEDLDHWRRDVSPNLPWADDHFLERVGGEPLNPGVEWRNWPWARSADRFRGKEELFNHTYAERLWPKWPRATPGGILPRRDPGDIRRKPKDAEERPATRGIAWDFGDLQDLVELLSEEPHTRQAWIPLFFPEDTGIADGGRKPCTLGYQVIVRDRAASIWYPLRSCDLIRHWRDDVYLAIRLLLWIIERCRERSEFWKEVRPGAFSMHCTSLHVFKNDERSL